MSTAAAQRRAAATSATPQPSHHGAAKVVPNDNVMGPVEAAPEASCRYLMA